MDKKYQIIVAVVVMGYGLELESRHVRQVSMFVQEEIIYGIDFSHSIVSDQGITKEDFFVGKIPVQKEEFYKELEAAQIGDLRKEREKLERQKKSRMDVIDQAQLAIIEKLIIHRLEEIKRWIEQLAHEQLKLYYVYHKDTVESLQKLLDMQQFVIDVAPKELKNLREQHDFKGLQKMLDTIELWPDRLDQFFKNSVQNAIKNCDDTVVLKELLTVLSQ